MRPSMEAEGEFEDREDEDDFSYLSRFKDEPQCRNDGEFGYMSGICGYRRISRVDAAGNAFDEDGNTID